MRRKGPLSLVQHQRQKTIEELEQKVFLLEYEIETQDDKIKALGDQTEKTKFKILQIQKRGGADSGTYKAEVARKKMISALEVLEFQNECVAKRYNSILGANLKLKDQIDDLRREKLVYMEAFRRMQGDVRQAKVEVEDHEKTVDSTYKSRNKAQLLTDSVMKEFSRRQERMDQELTELKERTKPVEMPSIEDDESLKEAMRMNQNKKHKRKPMKKKGKGGNLLKEKLMKMNFSKKVKKGNDANNIHMRDIGYYAELWNNIQDRTGLMDVDELAMTFMQMEQIKMQKMVEANELITQIKVLKAKEKGLKDEQKGYLKDNESRLRKQKDFVNGLQRNVERAEASIVTLQNKTVQHQELLRALVDPIKMLYRRCDTSQLSDNLAKVLSVPFEALQPDLDSDEAPQSNQDLLATLASVEQRITEIVQFYHAYMQQWSRGGEFRRRQRAQLDRDQDNEELAEMRKSLSGGSSSPKSNARDNSRGPCTEAFGAKLRINQQRSHIIGEVTRRFPREKGDPGRGPPEKPMKLSELKDWTQKEFTRGGDDEDGGSVRSPAASPGRSPKSKSLRKSVI